MATKRVKPAGVKKAENGTPWKSITLKEFSEGSKTWRAQKLKSPEGKIMYSLRAFAIKKDGSETITNQGITFPAPTKKLMKELSGLLGAIHSKLEV